MTLLQSGIAKPSSGYDIEQSLRFKDGSSGGKLTFTPASAASSDKKYTYSFWFKGKSDMAGLNSNKDFDFITAVSTDWDSCSLGRSSGKLNWYHQGGTGGYIVTTQEFRDPASWYHCVLRYDSTDSTAGDRMRMFINGEEVTVFDTDTNPALNYSILNLNQSGVLQEVNRSQDGSYPAGCYMAEVHMIDGTALDASSFGQTDAATNQWKPIEYTGTYGTNGFYQKYSATELANSFTDSVEGRSVTANGNVHTDTSVKKIGTASAQFDGTGDYLSVAGGSDFTFGTGDWTVEMWFRRDSSQPGTEYRGIFAGNVYSASGAITLLDSNDGNWYMYENNTTKISATNPADDTWVHIAMVRYGANVNLYYDGVSQGSWACGASYSFTSGNTFYFMSRYNSVSTETEAGYMDEIRISDTARYTTTFTPSTTAFTNDANTMLLLHCDGSDSGTTFTDSSTRPRHAITAVGDVANTRAQYKIGDSSIKFDGTGDALTIPGSSDFQFGTGDFTIECWHYAVGTPGTNDGIISWYEDHTSGPVIEMTGAQYQLYEFGNTGTHQNVSAFTTDQWNHIALVRNSAVTKFYLNGSETYSVSDTQNYDSVMGGEVNIGRFYSSGLDMDGYLDEIRISDTARYTGTFTPSTTAFTADANTMLLIHSDFDGGLGADSSGNKNDFAATNLVATDQMLDTPTNNFATLNSIYTDYAGRADASVYSEGNLSFTCTSTSFCVAYSTFLIPSSGKWYLEAYLDNGSLCGVGIVTASGVESVTSGWGMGAVTTAKGFGTQANYVNNSSANNFTLGTGTPSNGDIYQLAIDADNDKVWIGLNNSWNDASGGTTGNPSSGTNHTIALTFGSGAQIGFQRTNSSPNTGMVGNFGQDSSFAGNKTAQGNGGDGEDFYYTPPTGYKALNTDNLDDPAIALPTDHFNTATYAGTGASQTIAVGFQPDFVWAKCRNTAVNNVLYDSVRGTGRLESNTTSAEGTRDGFAGFDSNGFDVDDDGGGGGINYPSGRTYVAWNWKAGGAPTTDNLVAAGGTPTAGSVKIDGANLGSALAGTIAATRLSANTTSGASIVEFTGTATISATFAHGLSVAPELVILKAPNQIDAWTVGFDAGTSNSGFNAPMRLQTTGAQGSTDNGFFDATNPSSTVVTLGQYTDVNSTSGMIAYCFHSVEGYSKIGSYKGNGLTDGTFVYTGFRPMWVMAKCSDGSGSWLMTDSVRFPYNVTDDPLFANESSAETNSSTYAIDILSNGFKCRGVNNDTNNSSANVYIYLAFAESPFKTSNAR